MYELEHFDVSKGDKVCSAMVEETREKEKTTNFQVKVSTCCLAGVNISRMEWCFMPQSRYFILYQDGGRNRVLEKKPLPLAK